MIIGKVLDKMCVLSKVEFRENLEGKWGCKQKVTAVPRRICWGKYLGTCSAGKINRTSDSADQSGQQFVSFSAPLTVVT